MGETFCWSADGLVHDLEILLRNHGFDDEILDNICEVEDYNGYYTVRVVNPAEWDDENDCEISESEVKIINVMIKNRHKPNEFYVFD